MNVSGILVIVPPAELDEACRELAALPGVDVHHTEPAGGRVIVTLEAPSVAGEVEGLRRIKSLPRVTLAEMVHHHFEEDREIVEQLPPDLEGDGLPALPLLLRD